MAKIVFLGTSGSTPTKSRNLPSVALEYEGSIYLFDCGEGTQRQIFKYSLNISKVEAIFISHIHGDHIIGIAGLVRTLALNRRQQPLYIFVPKGYESAASQLLSFDKAIIGFEIRIKPISSGTIYKNEDFEVRALRLVHSVPAFGFVFKEKDRVRFIKEKAAAAGLKGSMYSELLKNGHITVNGKKVALKDVTYVEPGLKVAYITDTRPVQSIAIAARGADLLIHEATFAASEAGLAKERKHSTSEEAALIAKKAKVKKLVLMHISARYRSTAKILKEAKAIFDNTYIAKDGMAITLERGS
ncbi:MAG: ribonuclease Z [Candidatus Marsarchaeota archaeon]|jgi:ribonuclease Z|nr:ribonuclease Z [Candidatus Marsarchaeota archaeon]MCL5419106.1 ribonuclease Z [Candidatus Marsarchaeota archaeon]